MFIRQLVAALVLTVVSPLAVSYESGEWTKVAQIYSQNNGSVFVYFESNSMPGCYNNHAAYLKGGDIEKLYSTILAAHMAGKRIKPLYQFDNKTEGYKGWGLCYIQAVYIK